VTQLPPQRSRALLPSGCPRGRCGAGYDTSGCLQRSRGFGSVLSRRNGQFLDRAQLDKGSVVETAKIVRDAHLSTAVPYGEHILASVADPGHRYARGVRVYDRQGKPAAEIEQPCPELQGQAVTRRGVVFGCADGALLVTEKDGVFAGEKIPYPRQVGAQERAIRFTTGRAAPRSRLRRETTRCGPWTSAAGRGAVSKPVRSPP
jgi:hypothetical protein